MPLLFMCNIGLVFRIYTQVDGKTIKEWLSILEASFVVFKLSPYFENFGKRAIKSPKYYFMDTGLLSYLLGIEKPEQVTRDPLVGQLFENMIVLEALKHATTRDKFQIYIFIEIATATKLICFTPVVGN